MVGGSLSITVSRTLQVSLRPAWSVTVMVMRVCPMGMDVPAMGLWSVIRKGKGVQLSAPMTRPVRSGTSAVQLTGSALSVMSSGQSTILGGSLSSR